MKRKWTEDEIWAWYKEQPWISGFNFIPSGAMDGAVWLLQEYDHENAYPAMPQRKLHSPPAWASTASASLCRSISGAYSMTHL